MDSVGSVGMITNMTKSRITVTLPPALVAQARRAVHAGRADSVSGYMAAALEEKTKLDELADMLTEMLAQTGGPLTESEQRSADEALGIGGQCSVSASLKTHAPSD